MGTTANDGIARSSGRSSELIDVVSIIEPFLTVPRLRVLDWEPSLIKETARALRDGQISFADWVRFGFPKSSL
jgi:hypothetical protein